MGAVLTTGLMVLILGGFLQVFLGNELTDTAMAVGGALLFSLFIIYDTQVMLYFIGELSQLIQPSTDDHDQTECGGIHLGHHPALSGHHQSVH